MAGYKRRDPQKMKRLLKKGKRNLIRKIQEEGWGRGKLGSGRKGFTGVRGSAGYVVLLGQVAVS